MPVVALSRRSRCFSSPRRGASPGEVVVVLAIVGLVVLVALFTLPRQRENARVAGCRRNLMQIGVGLALYERAEGRLPSVPRLDDASAGITPLKAILESLVVPDLVGLSDPSNMPKPQPGTVPTERPLPGFVCPSDLNAGRAGHVAPVSYRATTGDHVDGGNGGFAPGASYTSMQIEEGDGRSFTAAFSERSLGTGRNEPSASNYVVAGSPLEPSGCPSSEPGSWRGDAGNSWARLGWTSTLYNHILPPNSPTSCIADDGRSAHMGASSYHAQGVHVVMFDGSVRTVTSTIAPPIWRAMATITGPATAPPVR